jgi:hypothetical protein
MDYRRGVIGGCLPALKLALKASSDSAMCAWRFGTKPKVRFASSRVGFDAAGAVSIAQDWKEFIICSSLVDGEQMMRRKSLDKKTGAIDNGHSPQEWTAPSAPQKITVPMMQPL